MNSILGTSKFVFHELNAFGLHLLRSLLSERMTDNRRKRLGSDRHHLYEQFQRDGILVLHNVSHDQVSKLNKKLFPMVSGYRYFGSPRVSSIFAPALTGVLDVQLYMHVDTFLSSWKYWLFQKTDIEQGPLHYVPGSHKNTESKLLWLFEKTRNYTTFRDIKTHQEVFEKEKLNHGPWRDDSHGFHASLRMDDFDWTQPEAINSKLQSYGFTQTAQPVLVPHGLALVIADTSGLHYRGVSTKGKKRYAAHLKKLPVACADHVGDLPRKNLFFCDRKPEFC